MSQSNVCETQAKMKKCALHHRTHLINESADSRIEFGYKPKSPPWRNQRTEKYRYWESAVHANYLP